MLKAINIPTQFLQDLQPNKFALLQAIIPNMTDDMLWRIAQADYGHKADYCMEELRKIKKNQAPPKVIKFALKEVLELSHGSSAETPKEHWMRLFACTNLLMIVYDTHNISAEDQTLANVLESLLALDEKLIQPTIRLLVWRLLEDESSSKFSASKKIYPIYSADLRKSTLKSCFFIEIPLFSSPLASITPYYTRQRRGK